MVQEHWPVGALYGWAKWREVTCFGKIMAIPMYCLVSESDILYPDKLISWSFAKENTECLTEPTIIYAVVPFRN